MIKSKTSKLLRVGSAKRLTRVGLPGFVIETDQRLYMGG